VSQGAHELDREKLTPLLKLKYRNAIADAVADLGRPEQIGHLFAGFQKYLYQISEIPLPNFRNTFTNASPDPQNPGHNLNSILFHRLTANHLETPVILVL
jgi:hypothetical protein